MKIESGIAAVLMGALLAVPGHAADNKKVAISVIVEVPQLLETRDGVLLGLAERGYVPGKNLTVNYQSANGNMGTQQQISRKIVGDAPDVIVPITTPTTQSVVTLAKNIPVVFVDVTDPIRARVVSQLKQPGGNVTGVSDAPPIAKQLNLFKEIVPSLKRIGFVYNPGLDNSLAQLDEIKREGAARGVTVVESPSPTPNEVINATRKLVGQVDAIFIPNDATVVPVLEAILKISEDAKLPIFSAETRAVERGALASVGLNYTEVGKLAGHMAADVLEGKSPGAIDVVFAYDVLPKLNVVINKAAAKKMNVTLPPAVVEKAGKVIE